MQLRYTIMYGDNGPETLDFYVQALGLEVGFLHESNDYGELLTGNTKLAFSSKSLMTQLGKSPGTPNPKHPVFEIAFEVEDVEGAFKKAQAAGATVVQEVREEPWGQTTSYFSDPNGYLFEICSAVEITDARSAS